MKTKLTILILLSFCWQLWAENDLAGTTGFAFLKINYSARAAALGNAYTALADNAEAVFFNPAGLQAISSPQATVSYMSYFDGIQAGALSYAKAYNQQIKLAAFMQYMSGSETRTLSDQNGEYLGENGTFGFSNTVLGLGGSYYINPLLTVGANLKFLMDILDENSASAVAVDLAILHQTTNENLKLGVALKNFGTQISSYTESDYTEDLPNTICVGFSYHPAEKFYANLDVNKPLAGDYAAQIGVEYQIHDLLALRSGYKSKAEDWQAGGDMEIFSGLSFGLGFTWKQYLFDYAVVSYGDLGFINNLTLTYNF
ncbi:MAG: PorV/PorQ family protein [Candidatus Cloacimonadales bacterium]